MANLAKHWSKWEPQDCRDAVAMLQAQQAILDRLHNQTAFGDCVYQFAGCLDQAAAYVLADHIRGWLFGEEEIPE
jgi:hypothetical protein